MVKDFFFFKCMETTKSLLGKLFKNCDIFGLI